MHSSTSLRGSFGPADVGVDGARVGVARDAQVLCEQATYSGDRFRSRFTCMQTFTTNVEGSQAGCRRNPSVKSRYSAIRAVLSVSVLAGAGLVACSDEDSSAPTPVPELAQTDSTATVARSRQQVADLVSCFTEGMDDIGMNNVAAAKKRFARCFVPNASFTATFPNGNKAPSTGSDAWADFIDGFFHKQKGYVRTQHLAGNVRVTESGLQSGKTEAAFEMNAVHVFPSGLIDQGNGRIHLSLARGSDGTWSIRELALTIVHFNTLGDERLQLAAVSTCATAGIDLAAAQDVTRATARLAQCFSPEASIANGTNTVTGPDAYAAAEQMLASSCTVAQTEAGSTDIVVSSPTEATLSSVLTWRCQLAAGGVQTRHARVVDSVHRPGPADSTQPYGWMIVKRIVTPTIQYATP